MILLVLYRTKTPGLSRLESYIDRLKREIYQINIKVVDVDSEEGVNLARLYDIMSYPAFVIMREDDGQAQNVWQGENFPSKDEIVSYLIS